MITTLAEDGYGSAEVRVKPIRIGIITRATRTREASSEKNQRVREAMSVVQKGFGLPENSVDHFAEMIVNRASCAMARAESKRYSEIWRLPLEDKTQVSIEPLGRQTEPSTPARSTHSSFSELLNALRSYEVARHSDLEDTAPNMADMNKVIRLKLPRNVRKATTFETGEPAGAHQSHGPANDPLHDVKEDHGD